MSSKSGKCRMNSIENFLASALFYFKLSLSGTLFETIAEKKNMLLEKIQKHEKKIFCIKN